MSFCSKKSNIESNLEKLYSPSADRLSNIFSENRFQNLIYSIPKASFNKMTCSLISERNKSPAEPIFIILFHIGFIFSFVFTDSLISIHSASSSDSVCSVPSSKIFKICCSVFLSYSLCSIDSFSLTAFFRNEDGVSPYAFLNALLNTAAFVNPLSYATCVIGTLVYSKSSTA